MSSQPQLLTLDVGYHLSAASRSCTAATAHLSPAHCFNHVQLCVTLGTIAHQSPLSMDSPGKNTRVGRHALLQRTIQPRDRTRISYVFCIGGQVVTTSTTWEAQYGYEKISNINSGKKNATVLNSSLKIKISQIE